MVGQRIGNYEIIQRLGEGGMATVYLASHPELGRRVAVKVMNAELAHSDEMVHRFFNEARAASGIGHRGIVDVSDLGRMPSGAPYIVMELLEGESLADRMTRLGQFPLAAAAEIIAQITGVMVAAHDRGIVHRDLKPENLFLLPDPVLPGRELVKVLDFGIAKLAQRRTSYSEGEREGERERGNLRTRTGAILGTPRYMSPEQCRESRDVDHRADVYSLGVVLYEMLAGTPPFVSTSWGELAHMHIGVTPPSLLTHVADMPAKVAAVVHRALEKDPSARFQSMTEFNDALQTVVTGRTAEWPPPSSRTTEDRGEAVAPARASSLEAGPAGPGSTVLLDSAVQTTTTTTTTGKPRGLTLGTASEVARFSQKPKSVAALATAVSIASVMIVAGIMVMRRSPTDQSKAAPPSAPIETQPPSQPSGEAATPAVAPPAVSVAPPPVAAWPPTVVDADHGAGAIHRAVVPASGAADDASTSLAPAKSFVPTNRRRQTPAKLGTGKASVPTTRLTPSVRTGIRPTGRPAQTQEPLKI